MYDHVFVVLMENHSYGEIIGNSSAPYINNTLAPQGAVAGNYFAVGHPSLPNYLELTSASNDGITSDCTPSATCTANVTNVADLVEASGRSWKAYEESAPSSCPTANSGPYVTKHDPFVYYDDIRNNPARCALVVPYGQLATDLGSAASTPNYAFITPNLCSDMHDCSVATGDAWLSQNVPIILSSPASTTQHSLLIVVWDEDDNSASNHVAMIAYGFGVKPGYVSLISSNHYSLLRTIEASWSLTTLTDNDAGAAAMIDLFN